MKIGPFDISLRRRSKDLTADDWTGWPGMNAMTSAGLLASSDMAISDATVYSCINVIAEGVAMLPMGLRRRLTSGASEAAFEHPVSRVMRAPCPHMSATAFWKLVMFEKMHHGNHYSLKLEDAAGNLTELYPIENGRVVPFWYAPKPGALPRRAYRVSSPDNAAQAVFLEDEIFHVQNMTPLRGANYALRGYSVWDLYQRETMGRVLATEKFAAKFFANGGVLSGMISTDAPLTPEQARELRKLVEEAYAGSERAHKIGVFAYGAKFHPMAVDAQKSQMIESRKYDRSVMAGILRVSAHLINDLEKATFSNIEHLDLGHYKHCLLPHLKDLRETCEKDLLTPTERDAYYVDHDPTEMLRGDQKTFAEVMEKGIQNALRTPDEARAAIGLGSMPGGDRLYINSATVPLETAGQQAAAKKDLPDA